MSEILKIFGISVIAITVRAVLKNRNSPLSDYVPQISAIMIISASLVSLMPILDMIRGLGGEQEYEFSAISTLITAGGIAFVGRIASELCRENGEHMLKNSIDLACDAEIMLLALPIIKDVLSKISELIG